MRRAALTEALSQLDESVDSQEAQRLATTAIRRSRELAVSFDVRWPAPIQNGLVNLGFKERGHCYHYADGLMSALQASNPVTLELHRAIALQGTWKEHNAVVVTAKDAPLSQGLVLDAWRYRGELAWNPVEQSCYPWRPVGVYPPGFWEGLPAWRKAP